MMQHPRLYSTSSDYVYFGLRDRIANKELKPKQRLLEVKIASEMGVSRTPVREALRRLANEGLVKIVPNSGARVASPSQDELESAYSVREYLENLSVELACVNGLDKRAVENIENALAAEENACGSGDIDAFLEADSAFHRIIAESGRNQVLCEHIDSIMKRTHVFVFFSGCFEEERRSCVAEHRAILRAIAKRDRESAQKKMKEHLLHSYKSLAAAEEKGA